MSATGTPAISSTDTAAGSASNVLLQDRVKQLAASCWMNGVSRYEEPKMLDVYVLIRRSI